MTLKLQDEETEAKKKNPFYLKGLQALRPGLPLAPQKGITPEWDQGLPINFPIFPHQCIWCSDSDYPEKFFPMKRGEIIAPKIWWVEVWCPVTGKYVLGAKQVAPKKYCRGRGRRRRSPQTRGLPPFGLRYPTTSVLTTDRVGVWPQPRSSRNSKHIRW